MATDAASSRLHWPINKNFTLLLVGQSLSNGGDAIFDTTLVLAVVADYARGQAWAPLAVSGLLSAELLLMFLVRPFAGVWVDRWDARRTMLWTDGVRAALVGLLWLVSSLPALTTASGHGSSPWRLGLLYGIVLALSSGGQFFGPAQMALLANIIPPPQRVRAGGLSLMTGEFATIIGPASAGPLYFAVGLRWALAINAASFLCSLLLILCMRPPTGLPQGRKQAPFLREFHAGMWLFTQQPTLRTVALALAVAMFGIGALNSLNVFFVTRNLHAPVLFYGWLSAAFGLGSLVGGALGTAVATRLRLTTTFGVAMVAVGVIILLYAHMTGAFPALALYGLLGIPNAFNVIVTAPLVLSVTPPDYVGRIFALLTPVWSGVYFLSILLSGVLYSTILQQFTFTLWGLTFGPLDSLLSVTGVLVIAGGVSALWQFRCAQATMR